ncbi:MAG: DUF1508 domain-containing protein [Gemmatales bacterium]
MKRYSSAVASILVLTFFSLAHGAEFKFEIFQDAGKDYRWRLKNADGKVVASPGQGYSSKKYCEESVEKFKNNVNSDKVKVEFYADAGKSIRWRMIASNGQTVASSMFGYASEAEAKKAFDEIKKQVKEAKVEVVEKK